MTIWTSYDIFCHTYLIQFLKDNFTLKATNDLQMLHRTQAKLQRRVTPEEFKRFCYLVNQFKKQHYSIPDAQLRAYSQVMSNAIPFKD